MSRVAGLPDVLTQLEEAQASFEHTRPGTADSDVNVFALPVSVPYGVVMRAIKEIERLRSVAGAVSTGESFKDIRKAAKGGDTISS